MGARVTVINVGVEPAAAAGVGLLQDLRLLPPPRQAEHTAVEKRCPGPLPLPIPHDPPSPPAGPLMSEKPAFFPEECEAARVYPGNTNPPPPLEKNPLHGHQRKSLKASERKGGNRATERMGSGGGCK